MTTPTYTPFGDKGPTWRYHEPSDYRNGHPTKRLYGPCPDCGHITTDYGCTIVCLSDRCDRSANRPMVYGIKEPAWWTDGTQVYVDGNMWCAVGPGFVNLQESSAGFGNTPALAVAGLVMTESK
jgi:hypothetical protein